jgi:hypothetical protein
MHHWAGEEDRNLIHMLKLCRTLMSAALKKGGPVSMLTMMMAIMTVWKAGPQSLNAVPAMRARPIATPACGKHACRHMTFPS